MDQAKKVREFNWAAGQPCPDFPEAMGEEEVMFLSKMVLDEVMELVATVMGPAEGKARLKEMIDKSKDIAQESYPAEGGLVKKIASQADALVDIEYYVLNGACKKGVNLGKVFTKVHEANMAKKDPTTGVFLKREDGKIVKPKGWEPPNIEEVIEHQLTVGAWAE